MMRVILVRYPLAENAELRELGESDATQTYADGLNDPEVYRFMTGTRRRRQTLDSVRAYIRSNISDPWATLFGIFIDGGLRGTVRLHSIDVTECTAHMGITIFDRAYWGKGWARRAIAKAAEHGIEHLHLKSIYAGIYAENTASQQAFAAAGFNCINENDHADDLGQAQLWIRHKELQ